MAHHNTIFSQALSLRSVSTAACQGGDGHALVVGSLGTNEVSKAKHLTKSDI